MVKIKFGTDGWRAVIAKEFTVDNVARVAIATANWLNNNYKNPSVVIGNDFRFAGELFSETVAKVLANNGIKVYLSNKKVSTPAISLAIKKLNASLGVVITASHNPPSYNGYKLKGEHGGPLLEEDIKNVESLIPDKNNFFLDDINFDKLISDKKIILTDIEEIYVKHVFENFDIEKIKNSKFKFAFDAMYGAGQDIMKKILPDIDLLHCENNPTFKGIPPEPLHKNLQEFSNYIKNSGNISCGLAVDGDADRIALYDSKGNYIDSHHIILILIYYLHKFKNQTGKVVTGFSSTVKVEKLCSHFNIDVQRVHIGFKDICSVMLKEKVLVGGEESGGIAISSHLPERDGIWMGLTIWQFMIETGKSIEQIINEIYAITGEFAYERSDLHINDDLKQKIIKNCKENKYKNFENYKVKTVDDFDGYKYFFNDNEWLMIRPSGTEPVLRTYAESRTKKEALDILEKCKKTILN